MCTVLRHCSWESHGRSESRCLQVRCHYPSGGNGSKTMNRNLRPWRLASEAGEGSDTGICLKFQQVPEQFLGRNVLHRCVELWSWAPWRHVQWGGVEDHMVHHTGESFWHLYDAKNRFQSRSLDDLWNVQYGRPGIEEVFRLPKNVLLLQRVSEKSLDGTQTQLSVEEGRTPHHRFGRTVIVATSICTIKDSLIIDTKFYLLLLCRHWCYNTHTLSIVHTIFIIVIVIEPVQCTHLTDTSTISTLSLCQWTYNFRITWSGIVCNTADTHT